MKTISKILCVVFAVILLVCLVACTTNGNENTTTLAEGATTAEAGTGEGATNAEGATTVPTEVATAIEVDTDISKLLDEKEAGVEAYTLTSREIYKEQLTDFYQAYLYAKGQTNVSVKFALMAVAEAKLMESAVMFPTSSKGGNYAISRVCPKTVTPCLWGNDLDRFHQYIVCTDFIKATDIAALKALYNQVKGSGTYEAKAKEYLTNAGYTIKDTYAMSYSSDPKTWDALATSRAADSEAIVNTFDGLLEYNLENVQAPALAESYTVSADGLKYTFKIRQGVKWVDSQGREVAEVVADDFVAGMQHSFDAQGGLEYLVQSVIVGADDYVNGVTTDFTTVGVKAVDEYTLEYTLTAPCSYFVTMVGYNIFAPMSRTYYESKGGKFGADFNAEAESYTYGKDPDSIAYCGPYLVSNATEKNTIVFTANPTYWNKDNINIKTITWLFNDGSDATKNYKDAKAGTIDASGLTAAALQLCKDEGLFDTYSYISSTDATSYMGFLNMNRAAFANVNDATAAKSAQDTAAAARTQAALQNVNFRRALCMAIDRGAYNAQAVGDELKLVSLRNCYTPGNFVSLEQPVTIKINGVDKTYPAGTYYGQIMQDQIDADGVKLKVWDPTLEEGAGSSDGFDGWYSVANATEELNKAITALQTQGITVDAQNPIYVDIPYPSNSETYTNKARSIKTSVEAALGGKIIINLVECVDYNQWYDAGYYTDYGYEANYDIYDLSGWGPDYGDPSTYLDTFLPEFAGYMIKCVGIY